MKKAAEQRINKIAKNSTQIKSQLELKVILWNSIWKTSILSNGFLVRNQHEVRNPERLNYNQLNLTAPVHID